jgi:hypothetical protein
LGSRYFLSVFSVCFFFFLFSLSSDEEKGSGRRRRRRRRSGGSSKDYDRDLGHLDSRTATFFFLADSSVCTVAKELTASLHVCADGGANRLYDELPLWFPDDDPADVRQR